MTRTVAAIRFEQWLSDWDKVAFDETAQRSKPSPSILLFSMKANELRALSEPFRRERDPEAGAGLGIQRNLDEDRADLIRDYVRYGYPYSEMSLGRRQKYDLDDLRKPGWLPTAIIVNIMEAGDERRGRKLANADVVRVRESDTSPVATIELPDGFDPEGGWAPSELPPIEIIDGQHRLFAFDPRGKLPGNFELPVVAFCGLDLSWQAYLFWTINISPKRINKSHAFDLYPLLRTQDWLEKFDEAAVYREARAQEIVEFLFRHEESVWRGRVNMLGQGRERGRVSQAGWIRALLGTFLSPRRGLFGSNVAGAQPLAWTRAQQAAFLILVWAEFAKAVTETRSEWAASLRLNDRGSDEYGGDATLYGQYTLLNQEQGMRGVLTAYNDFFFRNAGRLELCDWTFPNSGGPDTAIEQVTEALRSLDLTQVPECARALGDRLAKFDWRSSDAPGLEDAEKRVKQAYRGSSGYGVIRADIARFLAGQDGIVGETFVAEGET